MSPTRWQKIEEVFQKALELDPRAREEFIRATCGPDADLQAEIHKLICHAEPADDFLESSAFSRFANPLSIPEEPRTIGPYRVVRLIDHGGMGTVYLAARADDEYRKEVAIKVMRRGFDADSIDRRFRTERQILANLDHPNIARLLDGGTTQTGMPYIVMEYIEGEPIGRYCERLSLAIPDRLRLFLAVCSAVHYAHQRLVVHLDVKPGNILVTADGVPKLLDFGIARLLDAGTAVRTGDTTIAGRAMTPDYASPEQLRGEAETVASDIYSLGVLLYELLSGEKPYSLDGVAPHEMANVVAEAAGRPPRRARQKINRDVDNIVMMAMHPDPQRRYGSVAQLSEDITRYLNNVPVVARKDTLSYRCGKFLRRNKTIAAAAALILIALVVGFISTVRQEKIAAIERAKAEAAQARAERRLNDFLKLTHSLLFDYHDAIAGLNGSTAVRLRLVRDTIDYLDEVARESGESVPLRRTLAEAYLKIGDVQGRPYSANLGDSAGALFSYQRALALLLPLSRANAKDDDLSIELSNAYEDVGRLLTRMLQYSQAIDHLQKALEIRKRLTAAHRDNGEYRRKLASIWISLGDPFLYTFDLRGALDAYGRSEEIRKDLSERRPEDLESLHEWAVSLQRVGTVYRDMAVFLATSFGDSTDARKDWEKALDYYRRAQAAAAQIVKQDPGNVTYRRAAADVDADTAAVLDNLGDTAGAMQLQRSSIATFTELTKADPANQESQFDLLNAKRALANMLVKTGPFAGALKNYLESIAECIRLVSADPDNKEARNYLSGSYADLSGAFLHEGDLRNAISYTRKWLAFNERSAALFQNEVPWRNYTLVEMVELGKLFAKSGDMAKARAISLRALAMARNNADQPNATVSDQVSYASMLYLCYPKDLRNPGLAVKYLERAELRSGNDPRIDGGLAVAYYLSGSRQKAFAAAARGVRRAPYPPEAASDAAINRDLQGFANTYDK